ncbi:MAG: PEP-CTERM sorting domain-containing protein [Acidobacteria bacterium]|nr:PEP-CTERM sorting domain-containing protein [Acidobacteriota bacterium]
MTNRFTLFVALLAAVLIIVPSASAGGMITFEESIGPNRWTMTPIINSAQAGLEDRFMVWKYVQNRSPYTWSDFHMQLCTTAGANPGDQSCMNTAFGPSPETDGISFDQRNPNWESEFDVDINGVFMPKDSFAVMRMNVPFDAVWIIFKGFEVKPGDVLSLHFTMTDFQNNTWYLKQHASIPEPATWVLAGAGVLALAVSRRLRK